MANARPPLHPWRWQKLESLALSGSAFFARETEGDIDLVWINW